VFFTLTSREKSSPLNDKQPTQFATEWAAGEVPCPGEDKGSLCASLADDYQCLIAKSTRMSAPAVVSWLVRALIALPMTL
jgi:hypothetical protein